MTGRRAPAGPGSGTTQIPEADDEVLVALDRLLEALDQNIALAQRCRERAHHIAHERRRGRPYREIVPGGDELIVTMMRENLGLLAAAASRLQHAKAEALYAEGMTMEEIGQLFGISHQRVSAMLKRGRGRTAGNDKDG